MYKRNKYPSKLSEEELEELPESMRDKMWDPGYVYFIDFGDGKQFKIGKTIHEPTERLEAIVKGANLIYPLPSTAKLLFYVYTDTSCYYLEQLMHMYYAGYNTAGEWFEFPTWMELAEAADQLRVFGSMYYQERWFELVPDDWLEYVKHGAIPLKVHYTKNSFPWITDAEEIERSDSIDIERLKEVFGDSSDFAS